MKLREHLSSCSMNCFDCVRGWERSIFVIVNGTLTDNMYIDEIWSLVARVYKHFLNGEHQAIYCTLFCPELNRNNNL